MAASRPSFPAWNKPAVHARHTNQGVAHAAPFFRLYSDYAHGGKHGPESKPCQGAYLNIIRSNRALSFQLRSHWRRLGQSTHLTQYISTCEHCPKKGNNDITYRQGSR